MAGSAQPFDASTYEYHDVVFLRHRVIFGEDVRPDVEDATIWPNVHLS